MRYWKLRNGSREDLLRQLTKDEPLPEFVVDGSAWHLYMESLSNEINLDCAAKLSPSVTVRYWGKEYEFRPHTETWVPLAAKPEQRFEVDVAGTRVSGRVDGTMANRLLEYKTTLKPPVAEKYADSWQWRMYLFATGMDAVQFHLCQLKPCKKETTSERRVLYINRPTNVTFFRYPELAADVTQAVSEFVAIANDIGWDGRPDNRTK